MREPLGATGEIPEDLLPGSEGGIRFAVFPHEGHVILDFGDEAVKWLGMDAVEAEALAAALLEAAKGAKS